MVGQALLRRRQKRAQVLHPAGSLAHIEALSDMSHHQTNPQAYGWTYQGANAQSRVEYWQHAETGVKMDFYPTTGKAAEL